MAGTNPLVSQGVLNRVRGALSVTSLPSLNITAPYLGREGISMRPTTNATDIIPTMTGTVGSQTTFMQVDLTVHLLKTQALGNSWRSQMLDTTALGELTYVSDASTFDDFTLYNGYIVSFGDLPSNGSDPGYVLNISGYIIVNNNLWNL